MCLVDQCGNPVRDNLFVCDEDLATLQTHLEMVAGLHSLNLIEELYVTMARQDRTSKNEGGNGKPTKKVQPLPLRLDASAAVSEVSNLVMSWAASYRDSYAGTSSVFVGTAHSAALYLLDSLSLVQGTEEGADCCTELAQAVTEALRVLDGPTERIFIGMCDTTSEGGAMCAEPLFAPRVSKQVKCKACEKVHTVKVMRDQVANKALNGSATVEDLMKTIDSIYGLPMTRFDIPNWVRTGRIKATGYQATKPTYLVGDVVGLLMRTKRRVRTS
jgi:hypothetical protein